MATADILLNAKVASPHVEMDRKGVSGKSTGLAEHQSKSFEKELDGFSGSRSDEKSVRDQQRADSASSDSDRKRSIASKDRANSERKEVSEQDDGNHGKMAHQDESRKEPISEDSKASGPADQVESEASNLFEDGQEEGSELLAGQQFEVLKAEYDEELPADQASLDAEFEEAQIQNEQLQVLEKASAEMPKILQEQLSSELAQQSPTSSKALEKTSFMKDLTKQMSSDQSQQGQDDLDGDDLTTLFKGSRKMNEIKQRLLGEEGEHKMKIPQAQDLDQKPKFKDMISSLFVQKNLNSEMSNSFANKVSEFQLDEKQGTSPRMVSQNLFKDMEAHVLKMSQSREGGQISLKLRPGNLGQVQVDVQVEAESVKIKLTTDKPGADGLLKSQIGELKQQLQSAGVKLDEIQISNQKQANLQKDQDQQDQPSKEHQAFDQRDQQKNQQNEDRAGHENSFEDFESIQKSVA